MNLTEMRAIVRRDLHDEDAENYRWTDDELDRHIAHAVKDLSTACPKELKAVLATTSGSREIDIAEIEGLVCVEAVEYPVDKAPKIYQRFSIWGDTVTLLDEIAPDGSNAAIYYGGLHTLDSNGSGIPVRLEELVVMGGAGYAAIEWAVYAINRANMGGNQTAVELESWGTARLNTFRRDLKRLGRQNRLRVQTLYQPSNNTMDKTTDFGA
ncbi:MAG: hypothetical protein PHE50_05505 [Dehalococcoidales bacterium]|nr:hypothetical protein [Dehalococcoidales bacterium]